jgi:hypothetical protein
VGVVTLALLSFLAGTSLACFQKSAENIQRAEDCCKEHCRHAMEADAAANCCQSHQKTAATQTLPAGFFSTKTAVLAVHASHVAFFTFLILQTFRQGWSHVFAEDRPPPSAPLYAFHCTLLI